jgi:O-antigen/teichoic acid export membrane protein
MSEEAQTAASRPDLRSMMRSRIARGALGVLALQAAALLLGMLVNVLLARMLYPQGFGRYVFAFTAVSLITMPLQSGLATLLVREVAVYELRQEWGLIHGLLRASNAAVFVVTLIGALVLAVVLAIGGVTHDEAQLWVWALALVPLYALGALRAAALRGLRHVVLGQLPEQTMRPLVFTGLLAAFWWAGHTALTPEHAMALHVCAMALSFSLGVVLLILFLPQRVRIAKPQYSLRAWGAAVLPFTMLAGMQVLNSSLDILMLGVLKPASEAGFFRAAQQFAVTLGFSMTAINLVLVPQFARSFAAGDIARVQFLSTWAARAMIATALPVAIVFLVGGQWILAFFYGAAYGNAWPVLTALTLGALVNAACGPVGNLMNMAGHERKTVRAVGESLCLNALLNLLLIPHYGATGAAIATMAGMMYWNLRLVLQARKLVGVRSTAFASPRTIR